MRVKTKFSVCLVLLLSILLTTFASGCSMIDKVLKKDAITDIGKTGNVAELGAEEAAVEYVKNIANGEWDKVLQGSTGDQLAIYMQLVPVLENAEQTSELRTVDVVDKKVNKNLAFITVHFVKTVNLPDYGSVIDDKQVLLSMKKIDNQWKVFNMNIVNDLKTKISD